MNKRWLKLAAVPIALSLVAAACGSDSGSSSSSANSTPAAGSTGGSTAGGGTGDFGGVTVTLTGPERDDPSIAAINDTLNAWGKTVNLKVEYTGDADWETNINTQVQGGNPPDISFFPQPGKLADFARAGSVLPLTDEMNTTLDKYWSEDYKKYGNVDGKQYGIPAKTDLKSLVWYQPAAFKAAGYEIPKTYDEFTALVDKMAAAGGPKPLCVGIESGTATGWTFTDWVEEMVLRQDGGDVYDQWVSHKIPFNDPQIVKAMQTVIDLWKPENVFASGGSIAATAFQDNGQALVDGKCFMHRQANFYAGLFPKGTTFADPADTKAVDVFYFPDINGDKPVLTAGIYAAAFDDKPATQAVMNYIATADYAQNRQKNQSAAVGGLSGYLSAAKGQDPSVYAPLEQGFLDILSASKLSRFDGSDQMPGAVGAGTFWSEGTSLVNGDTTAEKAAAAIEASWPK